MPRFILWLARDLRGRHVMIGVSEGRCFFTLLLLQRWADEL